MANLTGQWATLMEECMRQPYMDKLKAFLKEERSNPNKIIYPPSADVFKAFELTPYEKVKVVMLGQDPYHNGPAHGLAFSSKSLVRPTSLDFIFEEIQQSCYPDKTVQDIFRHNDLTRWAEQGVLLLNPVLTVQRGSPLSHAGMGWELFAEVILLALSCQVYPIVFMLWGSKAKAYKKLLINTKQPHLILEAAHPAAHAYKKDAGFLGCNHFALCNDYLSNNSVMPIDWRIL